MTPKFAWFLMLEIFLAAVVFAQSDIVFFSESPDGDEYYDSSWGFFTTPSFLELARNNKFPVDTGHSHSGRHSLRMRWNSQAGGDWGIAVASVGWKDYDFTQYDSICYWINAPVEIGQSDLPDLAIEDVTNKKSTRVWPGDYFSGVDGDPATWQKITIPINAFQPGTENCDFTRIKTLFHYQKTNDGVEHTAWIDDIRITRAGSSDPEPPNKPEAIVAMGYDSRIDLKWNPNTESDLLGYYIHRSENINGVFTKLNAYPHDVHIYSDFFGSNDKTYHYFVTAVDQGYLESEPSDTVSAASVPMSDEQLLTSVQEATFRYFYDYGHPVSGMARERKGSGNVCTTGGTGMGLMTLMVGAERKFAPRDSIAARILKILTFLQEKTPRYHGAWSHWVHGITGQTVPFSQFDDGGDLVETAFLIQGVLTVRQYFNQNNPIESEIRSRATQLWEGVEWDWYRRYPNNNKLFWHWSPNYGWQMNMIIDGFNEAMIVYLLAIASPTHPVPASLYYNGWCNNSHYVNGKEFFGYKQWVGWDRGGPLFFTHYSFLGFDPRNKSDRYCNYFENNRNITLINRAYCIANPKQHNGYSELVWGLTASDDPWGYRAHEPNYGDRDNGTITPTAAISAMPYAPQESIATLKHFYHAFGADLWGEFGFRDAFNLNVNWFASSYLAIDQGTIVPMIENYRTQLCWNMFMSNPEIPQMLAAIGWTTGIEDHPTGSPISEYQLSQNYPNPFNAATVIRYALPKTSDVKLQVFNLRGELVRTLVNATQQAENHRVAWDGKDYWGRSVASGIYILKLQAGKWSQSKRMVLLR